MTGILVPSQDQFLVMDPQSLLVSQGKKLRNVVLFEREDVRVMENGDVLTKSLSEIDRIKRTPGRFKTRLSFPRDMTSDGVRSVLEMNFPQVQNRRFSCAARGTQNSARLEFHGDRRVWDGKTINSKLKGSSVLYLVMEDEPPVSWEVFCPTESGFSMQQGHSCHNGNNNVNNQQLLPQSAKIIFSDGSNCSTKANVEEKSNLDAEIPVSPFFHGSLHCEEFMDEDFSQLPTGYFDDLLDGMDSTQQNSQSQTTQRESFTLSAGLENCCSDLGLTDQTSSPMTLHAFNAWNGTVGGMSPNAPVQAQSQSYQNQVYEACSTNTDTSGPPESGFSSEENSSIDGQALDLPQSILPEATVEVKPSKGPLEGGGIFQLRFDQSLPDAVTSAWATFGNKQVEVRKAYECSFILHGECIPAGDVPGTVTVTISTKNGDYLGKTLFTYVDQDEEILMQIIKSKKLQGKLFMMLGKQCENDESEENNTRTFGLPSDGRQRQSMDLLRCLVYTAARIGAEEFIRMIFSTSAGRIVFEAYKKESTLPEDMADANGHEGIAAFLRAITKRFSEEDTTSQMQSGGIDWCNLARAVEESEEQSVSWSSEKHVKQLKEDDLSEREYFGDAETSSDSGEERCHCEDQFEARFCKDFGPGFKTSGMSKNIYLNLEGDDGNCWGYQGRPPPPLPPRIPTPLPPRLNSTPPLGPSAAPPPLPPNAQSTSTPPSHIVQLTSAAAPSHAKPTLAPPPPHENWTLLQRPSKIPSRPSSPPLHFQSTSTSSQPHAQSTNPLPPHALLPPPAHPPPTPHPNSPTSPPQHTQSTKSPPLQVPPPPHPPHAQSTSTSLQPHAQSTSTSPQPRENSTSTPTPPSQHAQLPSASRPSQVQSTLASRPAKVQSTPDPTRSHAQPTPTSPSPQSQSTPEENPKEMEEKLKKLAIIFSCLPSVLITRTLNRDDVNGDVEIACQQLHKFKAMENSKDMSHPALGGNGSSRTGQEKSSTVAESRGKTNHDEIPREQGEVKELHNLIAEGFGDYNLGQSNRGQITSPSGEFRKRPGEEPREGPRGGHVQSQSSTQGFQDNNMGMSQGWGVCLGHVPKPKTKSRDRGYRGRDRDFQDANQLGGDNSSQSSQRQRYSERGVSQQNNKKRELHGGKAAQFSDFVDSNPATNSNCGNSLSGPSVGDDPSRRGQGNHGKPRNSVNRGHGQRGTRLAQNLSSLKSACHPEAIEQSRFQQNQLLVNGLSALTTEDPLVNFIEAMSGGEVEDVMMRNDKALITMANDITGTSSHEDISKTSKIYSHLNMHFSKIKIKAEERGLDSAKVTIEQVPVCTSIVVSGISDNTTRDAIELYFESPKFGGGPVERVEFVPKGGRAVVVFQDPKDVKGVLARQKEKPHVLNQAQLSIRIYHKFLGSEEGDVQDDSDGLGTTTGGADQAQVRQQSEMKGRKLHIAVDPDLMEFVTTSAFGDQLVINFLAEKKCEITWKPNNKMAVVVYQGGDESDSWQSKCIDEIQNYLSKFAKSDVQVNKYSWRAVVAQLSGIRACFGVDPPLVKLIDGSFVTRIVSLSTSVKHYEEKLRSKLEEIYQEETRKTYLKKTVPNVPKERLILLEKIMFVERLQEKNKELEIKLDTQGEEIYFEGPESLFNEATTKFLKHMSDMVEKTLTLSCRILKVLGSDEGLKKVETELENNDIEAVFFIDKDSGARIVSTSGAHSEEAERLVNRLTLEEKVQVDDKSECLLKSSEWREVCDEINTETAVRIHQSNWNDIFVAGFKDDVKEVIKKLNTFLENSCIREEQFVCSSEILRRYLAEFRQDDLRSIENILKDFEVKIKKGKDDDDFVISGNRKSLTDVKRHLKALIEDTVSKHFVVKQPGLRRYFDSGKGDRLANLVEKDQNCAIQVKMNLGQNVDENHDDKDGDGEGDGFGGGDGDDGGNDVAAADGGGGAAADDGGAGGAAAFANSAGGGGAAAAAADSDDDDDDDDGDDADDDDEQDSDDGGLGCSDNDDDDNEHAVSGADPFTFVMNRSHHKISWRTGKIEMEKADALVCSVGATSQAIIMAGVSQMTTPNAGDIAVSSGSPLANHVINTYCGQWNGGKGEASLRTIMKKCLQKGEQLEVKSIAFPVIGTGHLHFPRDAASRIMLKETISFCRANFGSKVQDIRFVVFEQDQALTAAFKQEMDKLKAKYKSRSPGYLVNVLNKSIRSKPTRGPSVSTVSLHLDSISNERKTGQLRKREMNQAHSPNQELSVRIFVLGKKDAGVDKAVESLKRGFSEACTTDKVENEVVSQLSHQQIVRLRKKAENRDVELEVEADVDRIVVRGHPTDVSGMVGEIWKEINEERTKKNQEVEQAQLVSRNIEWSYKTRGSKMICDPRTKEKIEIAYCKDTPTGEVSLCGKQFIFDWRAKSGSRQRTGEQVLLKRGVKGAKKGACRDLSHLPQTIPHFVSRVQECNDINRYLRPEHNCRCVLVHGVTGVGKTSTAIKVANDRLDSDSRTVVVYINCRYMDSLDDFAGKALQQLYHPPVDNPISGLKNRLKSQDCYTVLLLDNFEFLHHLDDTGLDTHHEGALAQGRMTTPSKMKNLITEIIETSRKVKLLITSSEKVVFLGLGQETVHLDCFKPEESYQLLQRVCGDRVVNQQCAYQLSEICSGIPFVLYNLALSHHDLLSVVKLMNTTSPRGKFEFLRKIESVPEEEKVGVCLEICFGRLTGQEQNTLITLALLRGRFTLARAEQIFRSRHLTQNALELARRSLLETNIVGGVCFYTFLRVIRDYCGKKVSDQPGFRDVFMDARNVFIDHFLAFLTDTFRHFLSKNASDAIKVFRQEEENISQLIGWCANDEMTAEQIGKCIDVFNSVGELLAKMIGKKKYESVFELLRKMSQEMRDQKRLSECLTSLGIKQVFHCSCSPGLCDVAAERAKEYLVEADRFQSSPELGINAGNSRAQCLSKLGRCLAKEGKFREAIEKIQQAIDIRQRHGDEDMVMLAATYNDMAVALSLEENHQEAITVREGRTLPIYVEQLGDHPFTATILNSLSNNYYALRQYDKAKEYSNKALRMRQELLQDHRDTAKSLFDLGMVQKERGELQEAIECLEMCRTIQERVLDENIRDLQRTKEQIEEVRNLIAHQHPE